jgi:hypothetical protein
MSESDQPEVDPGTTIPTPPTQPPASALYPPAGPIIEHPWQPATVLPTPVGPPLPTAAPVVVDTPYLSQSGNLLNCTMGNWTNEPNHYTYQWLSNATDVTMVGPFCAVTATDEGSTFTCSVTAANLIGAASATSNSVVATYTPPT